MLPPDGLCHAEAFALPPCAPKSHLRPLSHLGFSGNRREFVELLQDQQCKKRTCSPCFLTVTVWCSSVTHRVAFLVVSCACSWLQTLLQDNLRLPAFLRIRSHVTTASFFKAQQRNRPLMGDPKDTLALPQLTVPNLCGKRSSPILKRLGHSLFERTLGGVRALLGLCCPCWSGLSTK